MVILFPVKICSWALFFILFYFKFAYFPSLSRILFSQISLSTSLQNLQSLDGCFPKSLSLSRSLFIWIWWVLIFMGLVQLFFSYFKDLVGREVTVELKNDLAIRGTLHSVDQYLNIKLENTRVVDQDKYPHMVFIFLLIF